MTNSGATFRKIVQSKSRRAERALRVLLLASACFGIPQAAAVAAPYGGYSIFGTPTLYPDGSFAGIAATPGGNGVLITDANYSGTGSLTGILAANAGAGATTVTVTNSVAGTATYGIAAINGPVTFFSNGEVSAISVGNATNLTINAANATGGITGIYANNAGTGTTSITASGVVSGSVLEGIFATNKSTANGVSVQANTVSGGTAGIDAQNFGSGALFVGATGSVTGNTSVGIQAQNLGTTGTDLTVNANDVSGHTLGIYALNMGSGAAAVTASGTVTAANQYGIYISNSGTDATVNAATVSGGQTGIVVTNGGTGATHITATGDVTGAANYGILAANSHVGFNLDDVVTSIQPSSATGLTVSAANVAGGLIGIDANNGGGGAMNVTATGNVLGTSFYGVLATNGVETLNADGSLAGVTAGAATDLVVSTGGASGGQTGILAVNAGTGLTSVTTTGDVTGTSAYGIAVINGAATFDANGILQNQTPSGATGDITLNAAGVSGAADGIVAYNLGTGATHIAATGLVAATGASSTGIAVFNAVGAGDLSLNVASVSGGTYGISTYDEGTGANSITATGLVTAAKDIGVFGDSLTASTSLTINVAAVTGGKIGVFASNGGAGVNAVTATGQVTGTADYGVFGVNGDWMTNANWVILGFSPSAAAPTDLTMNVAGVSGGITGIVAVNQGSGLTGITATGDVTGTSAYGILAVNGTPTLDVVTGAVTGIAAGPAATLTIDAVNVTGGLSGIYAYNSGSGATRVTATGLVTGTGTDGIEAYNSATAGALTVNAANVSGGNAGIYAFNNGTGDTVVVATGNVTGGADGISAQTFGSATTSVTATGAVNGGSGDGIYVSNFNGGATDVTVNAATVSGGVYGIYAQDAGSGVTGIAATGLVTGVSASGIYASNVGSGLMVDAVAVTGGQDGIHTFNLGSGATNITATDLVTGTAGLGINAINTTTATDLNVDVVTVSGGLTGIYAENRGLGVTHVMATGSVTGTQNYGIVAVNGLVTLNGDGTILNTTRALPAAYPTDLAVSAAAVTGGVTGIYAVNNGTGTTSVTATGTVTGTVGDGIYLENDTISRGVLVSAASVSGGTTGIKALNFGTGRMSVTATDSVNGTSDTGIDATVGSGDGTGLAVQATAASGGHYGIRASTIGTGDTNISASDVSGGITGVLVSNGGIGPGTGATAITTTGTVTGATAYGIFASNGYAFFNGDGTVTSVSAGAATDLTVDAADVSGGVTGIYADNEGTGATNITARGLVQGSTAGINAVSAGGLIAITITGANADVHNASGDPAALAISAAGGSVTLTNQARLTGTVALGDSGNQMVNSGTWTTGGASNFGAGTNTLVNAASGTIQAASSSGVAETTRFNGLTTFVNRGLLSLQDGGSGDRLVTSGSVELASGSTLAVDVDDADFLHAGGTVTIDPGAVLTVNAVDRGLQLGRSTIVTADGGLTGQFAGLNGDVDIASAFLSARTVYDANNVYLDVTRVRAFADAGLTRNQIATGTGLDSLATSSPLFAPVALLPSDTAARTAFDHLSGEIHASLKGTLLDDSHIVRDGAEERLRTMAGVTDERGPSVWVEGFGDWGHGDSDGNAAAISHSTGGILGGVDVAVFDTWRVGFLGGYSHTGVNVPDRASSGESNNYHLGAYGGSQWGVWALRAGAAYSWHAITMARASDVTGASDQLDGLYNAGTAQAFAELGYGLTWDAVSLEPFANLAYVNLQTDGFDEHGGIEALHSDGTRDAVTFTTLGLHAATGVSLRDITASLKATLGWRHAMGDITPVSHFAFDGGNAFTIAGVPLAEDAAIVEAGFSLPVARAVSVGVSYAGQFGGGVKDNGIRGNLDIKF